MPQTDPSTQLNTGHDRLVVMGVSGCGKSTLAQAIARHLHWTMIEGDTYHTQDSQAKMAQGIALTDEDRELWLSTLAHMIEKSDAPLVMACSALKNDYRDMLRRAAPGQLGFVYMDLTQEESFRRVSQRKGHSFPASLVASQFAALQTPHGEPDVLTVDATTSTQAQLDSVLRWLGR